MAVGDSPRALATVAQPCGYPIDGQVDCLHHALVGIAGPVTLQQFDLYMKLLISLVVGIMIVYQIVSTQRDVAADRYCRIYSGTD